MALYHWWLFLLFFSSLSCQAKIEESLVEVYDNVLDSETAQWLHQECTKWDNPDIVTIFPLKQPHLHTPIEQMLDKILWQIYPNIHEDESPKYYVEFWQRTEWQHILAHADMDEGWERETKSKPSIPLKHPETGHVLYLNIGSQVHGPTVVWNVTKGGELTDNTEMIVVPAVEGRLLRFQGNALHAVPRPADVYWTHVEEDIHTLEYQRSVLLFNTWPIDRMIVDYTILNATVEKEEDEASKGAQPGAIPYSCQPKSEWKRVHSVPYVPPVTSWYNRAFNNPFKEFWIPLMGDIRRRGTDAYVGRMETHEGVRETFKESSQVTSIVLQRPKDRVFGIEL